MRHAPRILWLVAVGLCLLSVQLTADEPHPMKTPLTQVSIMPTRVEWLPLADHKHLVLTVAGPEDFYLQRELLAGQAPSFSSLDFQDNRLPDGVYAYELRADGEPAQSGHLWVQEGRFVDKLPTESKPPIRNITAMEEVIPDNLVVEGHACIGDGCGPGDGDEATAPLHIRETGNYRITFAGLNCCGPWEHAWALQANDINDPSGSNGDFMIRDLSGGTIPFRVGAYAPDNALTIFDNGNIGLGTLTPGERFHVFGNTDVNTLILSENSSTGLSAAGVLRAKSNSATVNFQAHGSGRTLSRFGQTLGSWAEFLQVTGNGLIVGTLIDKPLILGTNSTNRIHIAADGKVGVGTSTPGSKLDVVANVASEAARVTNLSSTGFSGFSYFDEGTNLGLFFGLDNANNNTRLNSVNNNPIVIMTNSVEHTRIDSDGDVGINCNNPTSDLVIASGGGCSTPTSSINAGSSQFTVSSSRTLKENLAPVRVPGLLDKIANVNVFTYDFINGPKERLGLMAEDFHEVFGRGSAKVIDGQDVEMALWLAVQELTAQNKQLRNQNDEISRRLADLESRLETVSKPE
jgi:Chaperone of endosialidase